MKVLLIDNSEAVIELISLSFKISQPNVEIASSTTGKHGVELVAAERPDMVILDIVLPDIDGFEILRQIRMFSEVPVIILSERSKELDVLKSFELGADDYITKPFSHVGLLARVKAVLRRSRAFGKQENIEPFTSGVLHIDYATRQVTVREKKLKLTLTLTHCIR